jgi:cobalamin biosynthesis protein CbiG
MSGQHRNDDGRFGQKVTEQDILKTFDYEASDDEPYLTVKETRRALGEHFQISVTDEAVRYRLEQMLDDGRIDKRDFGGAVAYRARVGPRLSEDAARTSDARADTPHEEFVPLDAE